MKQSVASKEAHVLKIMAGILKNNWEISEHQFYGNHNVRHKWIKGGGEETSPEWQKKESEIKF